jgi:hypothetical protein
VPQGGPRDQFLSGLSGGSGGSKKDGSDVLSQGAVAGRRAGC